MSSAQIVTAAIAAYAAVVSTLSLILALRVHRDANPKVELDWSYSEPDRKLILSIINTGRADITIETVDLYMERHVITSRSPDGKSWASRTDKLGHIPIDHWLKTPSDVTSARLASYSAISVQVSNDIGLPSHYSVDELWLKFVARFPGGKTSAHLGGDVLRHFAGIEPDRPITYPSPGSLPIED